MDGDAAGLEEFLFLSRNSSHLRASRLRSLGDFFFIFRLSFKLDDPVCSLGSLFPGGWSSVKMK